MHKVAWYCRWEHPEKQRYYVASLQRDLFGWIVLKAWGRMGTCQGGMMSVPCGSEAAALQTLQVIAKQRASRKYSLVMTK